MLPPGPLSSATPAVGRSCDSDSDLLLAPPTPIRAGGRGLMAVQLEVHFVNIFAWQNIHVEHLRVNVKHGRAHFVTFREARGSGEDRRRITWTGELSSLSLSGE